MLTILRMCGTLVHGHPGLKGRMPYHPYEAKGMLISAIKSDIPVLFLDGRRPFIVGRGAPQEDG